MNAGHLTPVKFVEPGALPARVSFFSQRREIDAMTPARAFLSGVGLGVLGTIAAAVVLFLFSLLGGCASAPSASTPEIVAHLRGNGTRQTYEFSGRSMLPAFALHGTVIVNTAAKFEDIRNGDVVVYVAEKFGRIQVSHRAFKRMPGGWWTKGDANPLPDDELVTPINFVGIEDLATVHNER